MDARAIIKAFYSDSHAGLQATNASSRRFPLPIEFQGGTDVLKVRFIAARGPEMRSGFSGSGYPFASAKQAFEDTPNIGICAPGASAVLEWPNAYYDCGTRPPCLHVCCEVAGGNMLYMTYQLPPLVSHRAMDPDATRGPFIDRAVIPLDLKLQQTAYPALSVATGPLAIVLP